VDAVLEGPERSDGARPDRATATATIERLVRSRLLLARPAR